jgi:xyloglucan-specific endo-beta-1,4-glucanase
LFISSRRKGESSGNFADEHGVSSYTGSNIVGDVSYDLFTGTSLTGTGVYEIMVWLAAYGGAFPISATGQPIATVTIGGVSFKLYKGSNGTHTTFSFVATSNQQNFSSDLNDFIQYLVKNQGIPGSQILQSIGAGTEPFTGSNAVLTTSSYSVSIS